jgi:RimJ/RimL family protein N-acetyltransferase
MTIELARWQDLTVSEQAAVAALSISAEQLEFAGRIEKALASCEAANEADANQTTQDLVGLAIRKSSDDGDLIVGFLVLKRRSQAPAWARADAAVVSGMRINQTQQGKGAGTAALKALAIWTATHWPESSRLSLEVDEENTAGIRAYNKAGFTDDGARKQGRIGWVRTLTMPISEFPTKRLRVFFERDRTARQNAAGLGAKRHHSRAMASICNDNRACFGVMSGHHQRLSASKP